MPRSAAQRSRTSSGADTSRVGWTTSAMRVGGDLATTSQTLVPSASGRLRRARWGTVRMMDADRGPGNVGRDELRAAIGACIDCAQAGTAWADADAAEEEVAELRTCIGLCSDCAEVCGATARVLSRQTRYGEFLVQRLLQA